MTSIHTLSHGLARRCQRGFSLLELSIALVVIGLLIGAVAVGRDLQRSAANQRLSTDFIQGWPLAYEAYFNHDRVHQGIRQRVPGDTTAFPTHAGGLGNVRAFPVLGGLHHAYRRAA